MNWGAELPGVESCLEARTWSYSTFRKVKTACRIFLLRQFAVVSPSKPQPLRLCCESEELYCRRSEFVPKVALLRPWSQATEGGVKIDMHGSYGADCLADDRIIGRGERHRQNERRSRTYALERVMPINEHRRIIQRSRLRFIESWYREKESKRGVSQGNGLTANRLTLASRT